MLQRWWWRTGLNPSACTSDAVGAEDVDGELQRRVVQGVQHLGRVDPGPHEPRADASAAVSGVHAAVEGDAVDL
ncbi:hypothetical protein V1227_30760 [Lentzea sp. DG1S-22]|uniref:hypothetical protein n=1 Tax=Lentzea sp. DG1S-22 TaxID=3108822 RepID=UPI002E786FDB|nr:hypothetical protein [Lentzea sp. DG1S-22]WVH79384.1 hypothetical protein V1227_30760 [Lentzea sp. DG1S-22]